MKRVVLAIAMLALVSCSSGAGHEASSAAKRAGHDVTKVAAKVVTRASDVVSSTTVTLRDIAYSPQRLTVPVGKLVRWVNRDGFPHTVTSENNAFDSGDLGTDKDFSFRFAQSGTYTYYCHIHGKNRMSGTIVVK